MTQQTLSDLQAELGAIRQKLAELEARQNNSKHLRGSSTGLPLGWIPWITCIVLISGLAFATSDALFIDSNGNVGIGTNDPQALLHVAGSAVFSKRVGIGNTAPKALLDVSGNAVVDGSLDVHGNAVMRGNVGIGASEPKGFQIVLPESSKTGKSAPGITLAGGKEGNAGIELRNAGKGTPYIDYSQGTDKDYDARIILSSKDELKILAKKVQVQGDLGIAGKVTAPGMVAGGIFVVMDKRSSSTRKCTPFGTGQCPTKCAPGSTLQSVVSHYCNVYPLGDGYCYLHFCIST